MGSRARPHRLELDGCEVAISNPGKVYFPALGLTKLDVVQYYLAVADGALRAAGGRPLVLKRYPDGVGGDHFYQKRAPRGHPGWIETVRMRFPSGRTADEVVLRNRAQLAWLVNLGCLELHAHPVRADDLDHPDELRIDLDPVEGVPFDQVRQIALEVRDVLEAHELHGWPKTSGSRGIHVYARIEPRWPHEEVRRAALAVAREVERRRPDQATSAWWKEERHGVFLDYNQNARDRTIAAAYSVRPTADARVSAPLRWDEVPTCDPAAFTVQTMPARFERLGDVGAGMDRAVGRLDRLLDLARRQEEEGAGEAPFPPHHPKAPGEPVRAAPSRRSRR